MTDVRDDDNRTLYIGNLDSRITEELLYELFLQAGPVQHVTIPKDKASKKPKSFGFICFKDEVSMPYGYHLFREIQLFGRTIKLEPRNKRYNIPPMTAVGVHSLDPQMKNNEPDLRNFLSRPQEPFMQSLLPAPPTGNNFGILPFTPFPMNMTQAPYATNNSYNGCVNGPPSVDTNTLNNFKQIFNNHHMQQEPHMHNYMQNANFSPSHNHRYDGEGNFANLNPRLSNKFSNNFRNDDGPYNRTSSPNSNYNSPYSRHSNSSHNSYNNSPYSDRNCDSPGSNCNSTPHNGRDYNRDRFYGHERDSFESNRRRSLNESGSSSRSSSNRHHRDSYHNDRYHNKSRNRY